MNKYLPELVVINKEGDIETLKYREFPALIVNEYIKQHKLIQELISRVAYLESKIDAFQNLIDQKGNAEILLDGEK